MDRLVAVDRSEDIFPEYRDNPIGRLLEYHNLDRPADKSYTDAEILVGMCMDHRERLRIPERFAYIMRAGGANLRPLEFNVSYAVAAAGVRHIALAGHTQCGMMNLASKEEKFVQGLVDAGWERSAAEAHFQGFAPFFEVGNEAEFVVEEARQLRLRYPQAQVAPLIYRVEDNRLYQVKEV